MRPRPAFRRWAARGGTATVAAMALAGGIQAATGPAPAAAASGPTVTNPFRPPITIPTARA
jgi:hypothetical protein